MYWRDEYERKVTTARRAISHIKRGRSIFIGTGCAYPLELTDELIEYSDNLIDNTIITPFSFSAGPFAEKRLEDRFRLNSFHLGTEIEVAMKAGRADYTPLHMSEIPRLIEDDRIPIDVALIMVSPPDMHGFCSYGVSVDVTKTATEAAEIVIAEVNRQMPRTLGDCFIHIKDIDYVVEVDYPIAHDLFHEEASDDVINIIAQYAATLIEDGATLQIGMGTIPNAVLHYLGDKKDLGVHTEMFSDGIIDLVESGVINGKRKTVDPEKIVASFCIGSDKLIEFVDNNPQLEFHPSKYTNNPMIIGSQYKMVAINSAPAVDLTGQITADRVSVPYASSPGGQEDFIRGASYSKKGRSILVLPSTTLDGKHSRILPSLPAGAGVSSTREDIHYVVTEYGIAQLRGKNIIQRALELINIAHPLFRNELFDAAKELNFLPEDQSSLPYRGKLYPREFEYWEVFDGHEALIRPLRPSDESLLRDLFYSFSDKTIYQRFMTVNPYVVRSELRKLANLDYDLQMAFGVFILDGEREELVAVSHYDKDPKTNTAEVSFVVRDDWQGKGLGKYLLNLMIQAGRKNRIKAFTANVLINNTAMLKLFYGTGLDVRAELNDDVYNIYFELEKEKE
ncbi:MAG: hypothetical protein PWQ88_59 [Candidatus Methanomethylophilaceae archaeon]|nr:hypothetical protein [Candidatus Methanomethylophilaceae archaeon]MDI3541800.1 hypothetical protein [Candidatus Methanomethylophilaceae archaeon]HIJ01008.1 GNAT family N-acetyltransferase [Candidatus Methanomethylophilaceae archaeon]